MVISLGLTLSILVVAVFLSYILVVYRAGRDLVTPWTLYLLVAIVDVYAPGILFLAYEIPEQASYVSPFSKEDLATALVWFTLSIPVWAIGYFGAQVKIRARTDLSGWRINIRALYGWLFFTGGWYVTYLLVDVANVGSLSEYLLLKAQRNYGLRVEYAGIAEGLLFQLAPTMLTTFSMLIGALFFIRKEYNRPILWGVVLPLVGWLFIATTFFRGSQIIYFLALFVLEWQRKKKSTTYFKGVRGVIEPVKSGGGRKNALVLVLLGSVLFLSYGAVRNYYNSESESQNNALSVRESIVLEGIRLIRGEGLIGLTRIINAYPDAVSYLNGKTYLDMMLLIIPRSIYTTKPDWYGVADISRGMGGPDSTQDAVTVPGEAYANFGPAGMLLVMLFGVIYGLFHRFRYHARFRFAYAFVVIPSIFLVFWMSFTGLVNSLLVLPFAMVVLVFIVKKQ